jgi:hypothetical protein
MEMTQNNSAIQTADYQKKFNFNTSINNIAVNSNSFIIYPNPNNGQFHFSTTTNSNISLIEIFNSFGQRVYSKINSKQQKENEISISNNGQGIYFLKFYDGKTTYSEKFLIQ